MVEEFLVVVVEEFCGCRVPCRRHDFTLFVVEDSDLVEEFDAVGL